MSKVDVSFSVSWNTVKGVLLNDGVQVSSCEVFCGGNYMSIIRWNTVKDCQRMGFGSDLLRCTLRHCVDMYGKPERMYYEWDKVNQYVMDWLVRVFGAEHQSYEIYTLDVDKVLEFVCGKHLEISR